ncbi:MAG: response regulator transcription factor [Marinicella sp.]
MKKTVIIYGLLMSVLLILLKTIEYKWMLQEVSWHMYVFIIAVFFTAVGMWFSKVMLQNKHNNQPFVQNAEAISQLGLSKREVEVLQKLTEGTSNQDIADQLFVSVNTVKTHLKNGFMKLEVNNRIQAINKLKDLSIFE